MEMSENATRAGRFFKLRDDGGEGMKGRNRTNGKRQLHVFADANLGAGGPL